jgi:SAM-dependent methyltransferase
MQNVAEVPAMAPNRVGVPRRTAASGQEGRLATLVSVLRRVGLRDLWRARRARTWGWEGLLRGHVMTRVVQTLLAAGVLDAIRRDRTLDVARFAAERGLNARILSSLCEYLASRRVLRAEGHGRYALDPDGVFLMESALLRGWLQLTHGYEDVLHGLGDLLAGRRRYAADDLQRDGELVATGSGLASAGFFFPLTVQTIRQAGYRCVLDIGCGDATFLRYLCSSIPGVQGVGIDRSPEAVSTARERIAAEGLGGRVRVICGDAFELGKYRTELQGVDASTSFFVLHELCGAGGEVLRPFLETYRLALPGVPLIGIEAIRPTLEQMRQRPGPALEYTLLHDLSNQTTMGRGAWRQTFLSAGFEHIGEQHFDFARASIITAR